MARSTDNPWLTRFAILTAIATLCLISLGGLVTSHSVGMSVPDWPTTYGYNMFFFPFSKWVGGVFYEHSHRLAASAVGFLTVILAVWLWLKEERRWLRGLGILALLAVILQGLLGGLRVRWMQDELGIFHAALAQLFFVLVCSIALFSSRRWQEAALEAVQPADGKEPAIDDDEARQILRRAAEPVAHPRARARTPQHSRARVHPEVCIRVNRRLRG